MYAPAHPGALIRESIEGIAEETGQPLTIGQVAEALAVSRQALSAILNKRARVTPEMAFKLGKALGPNPEFWMRAQENYDLALTRRTLNIDNVRVLWSASAA
jgi:addiction module HigA family antidote